MTEWQRETSQVWEAVLGSVHPHFGHDPYPTVSQKAARILYGGVKGHGLGDGNKRLSAIAMSAQLRICGFTIDHIAESARFEFVQTVASLPAQNDYQSDVRRISRWINARMRPLAEE